MPTLHSTGTPNFPVGTSGSVEGSFSLSIAGLNLPANSAILVTFIARVDSPNDPYSKPREATFFAVGGAPEPSAVVSFSPEYYDDTAQVVAIHFPEGFTGEYTLGFVFDSWAGCGPFTAAFAARYSIIESVAAESLAPENFFVLERGRGDFVSEAATDLLFVASSREDYLTSTAGGEPYLFVDPDTNFIPQETFELVYGPEVVVGEDRYSWVAAKVGTVSFTEAEEAVYVEGFLVLRMWAASDPYEHFQFRGFADSYFPELTVAPRVDLREGVGTGCPPYTPRAPGGSMLRSVPSRTKP